YRRHDQHLPGLADPFKHRFALRFLTQAENDQSLRLQTRFRIKIKPSRKLSGWALLQIQLNDLGRLVYQFYFQPAPHTVDQPDGITSFQLFFIEDFLFKTLLVQQLLPECTSQQSTGNWWCEKTAGLFQH